MTAKYLIRFDDLVPCQDWDKWNLIEDSLLRMDVRPIVAVVPENVDTSLNVGHPNESFWERVKFWDRQGWSIGMHGFQHRYETTDAGILGLNPYSEFAGLPRRVQHGKLANGLAIFRTHGVTPTVWVAPGHSFDDTTLSCLSELGINVVSDGFGLYPTVDDRGMLWIPQQIWRPRRLPLGVWTICIHINTASVEYLTELINFIAENRKSIIAVSDIRNHADLSRYRLLNSWFEFGYRKILWCKRLRDILK